MAAKVTASIATKGDIYYVVIGYYTGLGDNRKRKQKWIKTETSRRLRHYKHIPKKGNTYRKLFDYWWEMY